MTGETNLFPKYFLQPLGKLVGGHWSVGRAVRALTELGQSLI